MSLWFRWGAWCVLNCLFLHRSLSLIPRAPRIRQKKYISAKGGSKLVDWSKGKWGQINTPFWSIVSKLNPFKTKIKNPPLLVIFHNQNQLKTGRLSLDRKTRTEHVYMYICKYHHTIISSYFSFIIMHACMHTQCIRNAYIMHTKSIRNAYVLRVV